MKLMLALAGLFVTAALLVLASAHALQALQTTAVEQTPDVGVPREAASSYWYGRPQQPISLR
jgi:hypothetical protein